MDSHASGPATAASFPRGGPGTAGGARRPSVAVIGAGVSGLTAAYLLTRSHDVILFEAADRLGGHAHTHDVPGPDGSRHAVDSGFIVHNDRTYPWLRKLFGELGIQVRRTEMSMSVQCEECGLQYAGGRGLRGILAQPRRGAGTVSSRASRPWPGTAGWPAPKPTVRPRPRRSTCSSPDPRRAIHLRRAGA